MQKTDTRKKAYALVKRVLYNIKEEQSRRSGTNIEGILQKTLLRRMPLVPDIQQAEWNV